MLWALGVLEKILLRWRMSADSMDANLLADLTMENPAQNQQHHDIVYPPPFEMEKDDVETVGNAGEGTGVDEMEEDEVEVAVGFGGEGMGEGEKTPGGESGNKKTTGVATEILLEDSLQTKRMTKGMRLENAGKNLNVSRSTLKHNLRSQSRPNTTPAVVDQEGISQLNFDTLPSDQGLAATADTNSFVVTEIPQPQFLPRAQQDEDLGNHEVEAVGMVGGGTGEGEMEEGQLNSGRLGKRKRKEKIPREERGNKKRNGVRIGISLEDILQNEGMSLKDASNNLNVSRSTLKRCCRENGIDRWPPCKKHKLINQSCPDESPMFVDQERITQLNSDALLTSTQVSATIGTNNMTLMARYGEVRIKFRLSWPWRTVELEQQVEKRLPLEAGTYYIKYKDEDDGLTLIACDEDLGDFISSSSLLGTHSIEIFLEPKVAHWFHVDQH